MKCIQWINNPKAGSQTFLPLWQNEKSGMRDYYGASYQLCTLLIVYSTLEGQGLIVHNAPPYHKSSYAPEP